MGFFAAVAGVITVSGCGLGTPSEELRYRLTVEVDTPEGLKTGSSVIAIRGVKNPDWVTPEARGTRASFQGEAAAVDLPGGKTLFALLETGSGLSDAAEYPWFAFADRLKDSPDWLESIRRMRGWKGEVAAITGTEQLREDNQIKQVPVLPKLVQFKDIRDPKSVERVDTANLAAIFGAGVSLRRITVEVTDDAVTTGLERRLGWLRQMESHNFEKDGSFSAKYPRDLIGLRTL
ncbi:MAG: hypothetical protein K2W81_04030 [Sphingomonas sp.]|uniref:hypothetical protein n=1 Tax=Sphingomonas sp. TaxID=28214 RepID=UPI0025FF17B8|nr:hypothetical protein [Sphingomonas sp.]MBY0283116.1 hypothetical protein [Sphingomonas sp.]